MNTSVIELRENGYELYALADCASAIKKGGLVVFPTETVYGLGADATNPDAVKNIYKAKGRPSDNPLIIHIAEPKDAERYAFTSELYYKLAECFMPGPLTVIMPAKESVPSVTRGGLDTVAVRCPSKGIARDLIKLSGVAIAAPSANISGSPSPTTSAHVIKDMTGRVDYIIAAEDCEHGLESTIVKIEEDGTLTLLRPGRISAEEIESECGATVNINSAVVGALKEDEKPLSPGMKYRHYAPRCELVLLEGSTEKAINYIKKAGQKSIACIVYSDYIDIYKRELESVYIYDFGKNDDISTQANRLFKILRETDEMDFDIIFAPLPPRSGYGLALFNRMIRAAGHKIIRL